LFDGLGGSVLGHNHQQSALLVNTVLDAHSSFIETEMRGENYDIVRLVLLPHAMDI
jgi:hypothetical protein